MSLVFQSISSAPMLSFTFFVEQWVAEFGVPRSELMLAVTASLIIPAFLGPIAGRAMDKLSAAKVIACGVIAVAASFALLSRATAVWHVVAVFGVVVPFGAAFAGTMPAQVLAARWFPERRGLALSVASNGHFIAATFVVPTIAWLIVAFGWRFALALLAVTSVAIVLPLVLTIVRDAAPKSIVTGGEEAPGALSIRTDDITVRMILRERNFWVLCLIFIPIGTALIGFQHNLAAYAATRGVTVGETALLLALMQPMLLGARFAWGLMTDRHSHRRLFCAAALSSSASCLALSLAHGPFAVGAGLLLLGVAGGGLVPLLGTFLSRQFGASLGRAFGLLSIVSPLLALGAPALALIQERWDGYAVPLAVMAVLTTSSAVAALFLREPQMPPPRGR